jgi:hypothetical protein
MTLAEPFDPDPLDRATLEIGSGEPASMTGARPATMDSVRFRLLLY